ncbi:histone deacetylase [Patulibacter sp.]|uniref:histone deacetylase family protein n=1 Tax=Patulibacter sp. TaxID=1912859 RepID=UPI002723DA2C|nr:histone deacetylase [Patulibacter sp.]MDO9409116.1 histone deacetylase [Patulibacter sp.]
MARPLFRHESSLRHETGSHPERADRMVAIERELEARDWCGFVPRDSPEATDEQLLAVHPRAHVERIRALARSGGGRIDADTIVSSGSWDAAVHGAGGAVAVVDALLSGEATRAASLHRPPGHHCETAEPMGFCLLNNVAIAARHAVLTHGLRRVLVLDWDVHHGNGTAEIFAGSGEVLFASIHEFPLYPGTGRPTETGHGAGKGLTVNLPVPGGTGDRTWVGMVEHVVAPIARDWAPELVLVSAGYDAHADDPLAGCEVTDDGFARIAGAAHRLAKELDVPLGLVLEGGYDVDALARSVARTLEAWSEDPASASAPEPVPEDDVVRRAREFFAPGWPSLAHAAG